MTDETRADANVDRRRFLKTAGAGLTAATAMLTSPEHAMARTARFTSREQAMAQSAVEQARFDRLASCTWPIRQIFKTRATAGRGRGTAGAETAPAAGGARQSGAGTGQPPGRNRMTSAQMKKKYGEITMLDFPQWTKDTFPGVTHMDIFSGLFGDVTDDTMLRAAGRRPGTFDPSSAVRDGSGSRSSPRTGVATGVKVQHISNNAPTNLASDGRRAAQGRRRRREEVARRRGDPRRQVGAHELGDRRWAAHQATRDRALARRLSAATSTSCRSDAGDRVVQGDGRPRRQARHQGHDREPLGPGRGSDEHPDHPRRRSTIRTARRRPTSATGNTSTCSSAASRRWRRTRTPTCTPSTGIAGATQRRAAIDADHARRRLQGHVRARVRSRAAQRHRRAPSTSSKK